MAGNQTGNRFGIIGKIFGGIWGLIRGVQSLTLTVLFYLLFFAVLGAMLAQPSFDVPKGSALVVAPAGLLVEQLTQVDPFQEALNQSLGGGGTGEVLVSDVVTAIDRAAEDERITALVLRLDALAIPTFYASKSYQIADAVDRFKASGKPVIALGNYYSQSSYLIASHADEVWMHPFGNLILQGYERSGMYYKSLLDNMMITVHPFKVGEYKSAIEPITRDDMSDADKGVNMALLGDMWAAYTADVEAERGFEPGKVQNLADNLPAMLREASGDLGLTAKNSGLVDALMGADEWRAALIEKVGEDKVTKSFKQIDMKTYLMATGSDAAGKGSDQDIAVVVAKGMIVNGEAPRGMIGGDTLARLIREARDNENTKAIVLRVDTGGGSAFASEIIRREIIAAKAQGITVVASMGSVAASGGYWISADADEIWAEPTTVTGSIGVIGAFMTFEKAADWAGIHTDGVGTTNLAGAFDPLRPLNADFSDILQQNVENAYDRFINLVATARDMPEDRAREIAEGRIWSAPDALKIGLVDKLGGLDDAIAAAAGLAGLEDWNVRYIEDEKTPFEEFVASMSNSAKVRLGLGETNTKPSTSVELIRSIARGLKPFIEMNDPNHVYLICEACDVQ